jgi:hypothetical protein
VLRFAATCGPSVAVQSAGKPIRVATHAGLSGAATDDPVSTDSPPVFRSCCDGGAVAFCAAFTVGVDLVDPNETATAHPSLFGFSLPSPEHVSVTSLPALALFGVGHW